MADECSFQEKSRGDIIRKRPACRARAQHLSLAFTLLLSVCTVAAERAGPAPSGRAREIAVVKTISAPRIDGVLADDVWANARVATDFWISEYQQAPAERTEVRILADDYALYFAVTCYDSLPKDIRADESRRDGSMGLDDQVRIELDPYHNHRLISSFSVNARGTQADTRAGGRSRNIAWKGDWQAAAVRTETGWTAEIAIPFDILDFSPATTVFGVNFVRYHSRTHEWSRWADVTPQGLPEQMGHIVELAPPKLSSATRLSAMPYASGGVNAPSRDGKIRSVTATTGLDVRLEVGRNLAGVVTVNPDFSQVEDAVLDLGFNYNEKIRPDPRPFFQEGAAFFGNRAYFHSGRIPDFLFGGKAFGRAGGYQFGVLATSSPINGRRDYIGSVRRELGPTVNAGVTVVGTERQEFSNQLVAFNTNGRIGRHLTFGLAVAGTATKGRVGDGTSTGLSVGYSGPHFQFGVKADRTEAQFFPADGFIGSDLLGTKAATAQASYGRGFGKGWLRRADASVTFGERQTLEGMLQRQDLSIYGSAETHSNIQISGGMSRGPYRPRANVGEWLDSTYDDRFYSASVSQYSGTGRYGYGLAYSQGVFSGADYHDITPSFWLKPTHQSSVSYSYERADYYEVSQQHILSFSWDVTPEQAISGRWVQYGEPYYRLAYRRVVRRGFDLFAVYSREPHRSDQFVTKVVWAMNLWSRRDTTPP